MDLILAYDVDYLRSEWKPLNAAVGRDLTFLQGKLKGDINVTSTTTDNMKWTVAVAPVTAPSSVWLFDRKTRALTKLYTPRPALEGMPLAAMHPVEIKSRDGLTLPSYLTLPPGADANHDGKADRPVPMVLYVHGGPWARDGYGYNTAHQLLANRGYAVLSVNYRGSTGFGKDFVTASNLQWGRKMHDDLLDATDWAVAQGVTTPDKVAIAAKLVEIGGGFRVPDVLPPEAASQASGRPAAVVSPRGVTTGCRNAKPCAFQNCSTNFEPPMRISCRLSRSVASGSNTSAK